MKKKYIIKYLFEFIVIVLGVSVSFWLSEISINNQNEKERIKVLTSLQMENKEIRNYCDERNQSWLTDINLLNQFLYPGTLNIDSILKITTSKGRIEQILIIYRVFYPPMNRYYSIINSGDLKYVKSDKIKEILSKLHNTSYLYVETTVEYEKQLKQSFLPFLALNHSDVVLARDNDKISMKEYSMILSDAIKTDEKLKSKLIMIKRYLEYKINFLRLYILSLDDLERELNISMK